MGLVDTHCHLDFDAFDADRQEVLARAWERGVTRIINPGVDLETSRAAVRMAESHPNIYAAVGIHPNDALTWDYRTIDELRLLTSHSRVVAIGEIGLDYYRDRAPKDRQREIFRHQLDLAAELGLPVIIHSRQSLDDTLEILRDWQRHLLSVHSPLAYRPGVLHSFEGDLLAVNLAVDIQFMVGVSGPITFHNAQLRREVLRGAPLVNVVLETDAPFLAPQPFRGQRNEPGYVHFMAEALADLHKKTVTEIAEITSSNASRLFAWSS